MLGCGSWTVMATARGGAGAFIDIPFSSLSFTRPLNGSASISLSLAATEGIRCCEVFDAIEPWRDELVAYRDGELATVGPITRCEVGGDGLSIQASDLSVWGDKRWIERDMLLTGDPARLFGEIFDAAMEVDDSPNIVCHMRNVGTIESREFLAEQYQRAGDAWRELSTSTLLDYVTIGRTIYAGDLESVFGSEPFIVHEQGLTSLRAVKDADRFATDLALVGNTPISGRQGNATGRATRHSDYYGVLQEQVTDLYVFDNASADAAAAARIRGWLPFPLRYQASFSPDAQPSFSQMVPGRTVTMAVSATDSCIEATGAMFMSEVSVSVSPSTEDIGATFVPVGEDA